MFIIYLDDMMDDYPSLCVKRHIPLKHTIERSQRGITHHINFEIHDQIQLLRREDKENNKTNNRKTIEQQQNANKPDTTQIQAITQQIKNFQIETPAIISTLAELPTGHQEYADDKVLCLELRNPELANAHITNYDKVTRGRGIPIQWQKVEMLTKQQSRNTQNNWIVH